MIESLESPELIDGSSVAAIDSTMLAARCCSARPRTVICVKYHVYKYIAARSVFVDHCRQVIGIALQRAICTQITNNVKVRKGVGSTRDYVDLCSSLPLTGRLLSAA